MCPETIGTELKLLCQELQRGELVVQPVQLLAQHRFIVPLALLQSLHLQYPPVHHRGAVASALNEVIALVLILQDLLLYSDIKFLCHLIPLLGVVNDIEAVDGQRRTISVQPAEKRQKVLKNIYLFHMSAGHKVHMARDADFGGLQRAQIICTDGFHLPAVGAPLVEFKQLLRPAAAPAHIHRIVRHQVIAAEHAVRFVITDIRQFFIVVGLLIQCLLHQFTGENIGRALVVPAVGQIDIGLPIGRDRDALPDVPGGATECVGHGQAHPA